MIAFVFVSLASAQDASGQELDFEATVRTAVEHGADAKIVAAEADRSRAEARGYAAWEGNPELDLEHQPGETTLSVTVPVEIAGQPIARASAARRLREAASLRAEAGRAAVGAAAGAGYLDAVRAREQAELAEAAEALAIRLRDAAVRRAQTGDISRVESALLHAEAARALDAALTLQRDAEAARRRLGVLIGQEGAPGVGDWPTLREPPSVEPSQLPTLLAAGLEARAALARLTAEKLERVPDIRLRGGWSLEGETGPAYGAAIEIPLFAPGASKVRVARAEADIADARASRETLDAQASLADARAELTIAERVAAAWDIPGLDATLDAAARRYEVGEASLSVFVAERDLALTARRGAIDARWRLERARLALWELAGQLPLEER
ncbi:MAG: TolC family protein [Pseudomonadota bacterium]|nr:TolC family protein [Pseudomonadota bacterium]